MPNATLHCVTCDHPVAGRYCTHCGEKCLQAEDHTLRHFFAEILRGVINADGKVFLTLRLLLAQPGRLTADYLRGRRKPYIPPLELFLISNLLFFLLHPLIGSNILTTDLNTQLHYAWYKPITAAMVGPRLITRSASFDAYALVFDAAAVTQAKSLVILVVPIFSLAALALYWRHRRHFTTHLVFALHFGSFWLLLVCVTLSLTNGTVRLLRLVRVFPSADVMGYSLITFLFVLMSTYLYRAVRMVYNPESMLATVAKALMLGFAFDLSLQVYRFVLFFITFWST